MATDYVRILPKGKQNAMSTADLVALMNFKDIRSLRADIARSRAEGQIICSSTKGGYYLPATREELKEFTRSMENRAKEIFIALKSARKALREIEGQMEMKET